MDAKPMDKRAEERLMDAVKQSMARVLDGEDPTQAVIKVARDMDLNPQTAGLLCQAYNTGRTTYQRDANSGDILNKMANFPIVRIEDVHAALWPHEPRMPKLAAHEPRETTFDCYNRPPVLPASPAGFEKAAFVALPKLTADTRPHDEKIAMQKAYGQAEKHRKAAEEARRLEKAAEDRCMAALSQLGDYFRYTTPRPSLSEVEYHAQLMFGPAVKHAFDYVCARNQSREKRADGHVVRSGPVDRGAAPYSLVREVLEATQDLHAKRADHQRLVKQAETEVGRLLGPFDEHPSRGNPSPSGTASSASFLSVPPSFNKAAGGVIDRALTGLTGALVGRAVGAGSPAAKPTAGDALSTAQLELADPNHLNQLRQIEAQTMLNDFLNNDEVLSGYDPEEVLSAYNELASMSPTVATQPAVMRPLLRKRLTQGSYEPYEAQQVADIEKSVRQTQGGGLKFSQVLHGSEILR